AGREPIDVPAVALLVRLQLRERRARDHGETRILLRQDRKIAQRIDEERAARAAILPIRIEHEMVDDELAAAFEQIEQAALAARSLKLIILLDLHHRQAPALRVDPVAML